MGTYDFSLVFGDFICVLVGLLKKLLDMFVHRNKKAEVFLRIIPKHSNIKFISLDGNHSW